MYFRWFDSNSARHAIAQIAQMVRATFLCVLILWPVSQAVKISLFHGEDRSPTLLPVTIGQRYIANRLTDQAVYLGFYVPLVQLAEPLAHNRVVIGSIPIRRTNSHALSRFLCGLSEDLYGQVVQRRAHKTVNFVRWIHRRFESFPAHHQQTETAILLVSLFFVRIYAKKSVQFYIENVV